MSLGLNKACPKRYGYNKYTNEDTDKNTSLSIIFFKIKQNSNPEIKKNKNTTKCFDISLAPQSSIEIVPD